MNRAQPGGQGLLFCSNGNGNGNGDYNGAGNSNGYRTGNQANGSCSDTVREEG